MSLIAFPAPADDEAAPVVAPNLTGFEDMPMFMSPGVLAVILDISTRTLIRWRDDTSRKRQQVGPRWVKIPNSQLIRYTRADVLAWLAKAQEESK